MDGPKPRPSWPEQRSARLSAWQWALRHSPTRMRRPPPCRVLYPAAADDRRLPCRRPACSPTAPPGAGGPGAGGSFLGMKINEKKRMQDAVAGHRTGLPGNILRLFAPRAPLPPHKAPNKKPPKLPCEPRGGVQRCCRRLAAAAAAGADGRRAAGRLAARPSPFTPHPSILHHNLRADTGVAAYLDKFAEPGDAEYEPPAPETRPPEPRLFRSRELPTQVPAAAAGLAGVGPCWLAGGRVPGAGCWEAAAAAGCCVSADVCLRRLCCSRLSPPAGAGGHREQGGEVSAAAVGCSCLMQLLLLLLDAAGGRLHPSLQ